MPKQDKGRNFEDAGGTQFRIKTPSKNYLTVLTKEEKEYGAQMFKRYEEEYQFENPADISLLESLVSMQILLFRYSNWLTSGVDYDGNPIEYETVQNMMINCQREIRQLQDTLGISRKSRLGSDAKPAEIIMEIAKKAKEYGVMKNQVAWKFLLAYYEIRHLIGLYKRCDDVDRKRLGATAEETIEKIDKILSEIEQYEEEFRQKRKLWISLIKDGELGDV